MPLAASPARARTREIFLCAPPIVGRDSDIPRAHIYGSSKMTSNGLSVIWSEIVGKDVPLHVKVNFVAEADPNANVGKVIRRVVAYGTKGPYRQGIAPQEYANENEALVPVPLVDTDALLAYFRLMPRRQLISRTGVLRGVKVPKSSVSFSGSFTTHKLFWDRKNQHFVQSTGLPSVAPSMVA